MNHDHKIPHVHEDERGFLVKCYHNCKNVVTDWKLWFGITLTYPLEHWLWEQVWPFNWLASSLGLM